MKKLKEFSELTLPNGQKTIIDSDKFEELSKTAWYSTGRYVASKSKGKKQVLMHRLLMSPKEGMQIDHINGNSFDNRLENLRLATASDNQHNITKTSGKYSSDYKGVHWSKSKKKWQVQINLNNKRIFIGLFGDEKLAALAYDIAAIDLFGKFSRLNFKGLNPCTLGKTSKSSVAKDDASLISDLKKLRASIDRVLKRLS